MADRNPTTRGKMNYSAIWNWSSIRVRTSSSWHRNPMHTTRSFVPLHCFRSKPMVIAGRSNCTLPEGERATSLTSRHASIHLVVHSPASLDLKARKDKGRDPEVLLGGHVDVKWIHAGIPYRIQALLCVKVFLTQIHLSQFFTINVPSGNTGRAVGRVR